QYGYNLGCIDGIDIEDYTEIPMRNGQSMSLVSDDE
ncbi:MAG TPA: aldehyde-activating protein, partial [Alphaproteobacteria bacterium]|nr:aldehyde-activating protein [Alphaproteobacteria bacterium]